jgi:succinate dehydrogenase / fumarate reductase cytochrome b subunit
MSQTQATRTGRRARPVSPHLTVYRWPITMLISILHRITGGALYFGTLLVAWWLVAAATSERQFDIANAVFGSWFGLLVLFGYSWALIHHMVSGIRHLVWDTGAAMEKHTASRMAWANIAISVAATILVWVVGYMARGA